MKKSQEVSLKESRDKFLLETQEKNQNKNLERNPVRNQRRNLAKVSKLIFEIIQEESLNKPTGKYFKKFQKGISPKSMKEFRENVRRNL